MLNQYTYIILNYISILILLYFSCIMLNISYLWCINNQQTNTVSNKINSWLQNTVCFLFCFLSSTFECNLQRTANNMNSEMYRKNTVHFCCLQWLLLKIISIFVASFDCNSESILLRSDIHILWYIKKKYSKLVWNELLIYSILIWSIFQY